MIEVFDKIFTVNQDHIDQNNHLNNVVYIQWMQDIAIMHSEALGWGYNEYKAKDCSWVVKSHQIKYLRAVALGDQVIIKTWLEKIKNCSCIRKYAFYNSKSEIIAKAETLWIFIGIKTGKPVIVPSDIRNAFSEVEINV
jgi:acyl-CoA thioester hydrolase